MEYVIGVDSGGTHIVAQALSQDGKIMEQSESGPGNILLNPEQTIKNLKDVIESLFLKQKRIDCKYILIGIAGIETTGNSSEISQLLTDYFKVTTYVISDAKLALLNGLEGKDGTLIISGTGSVVYGRQNKEMLRYGGWGNLLGDTGSAYKIVSASMQLILKKHDLGFISSLEDILLNLLNASDVKEGVKNFYQLDRKQVASIAVTIAKAADKGNLDAITIIKEQAMALSKEALGLISRYQKPYPSKIAFSGSVLLNNDLFQKTLLNNLLSWYPNLQSITVSTNNSRGAIFWPIWNN
ncbi:BadF/BadG/BcrA/BcrD ATPase family protein [Companilactobacillus paralimentarius]|uniref:BadF/BadG/BcrA/BcrD ATPase family protein n=1 Tax=Companilactobacillus paralimentarius TaxID=83526 RepID=UPI00384C0E57